MGRRVEVDEALAPVPIPGRIANEACAHAREAWPEECCGLIVGDVRERFAGLFRCRNEMTQRHSEDPLRYPRDNRTSFWMSPADMQHALETADRDGREITAVYHSHVDADAYLSEADLEFAEPGVFPAADQIVIAVSEQGVRRMAIFRRETPGGPFVGRNVAVTQP